ncbi:MAG: M50 family metallopeptidase [Elusimicrobiota bacterium]
MKHSRSPFVLLLCASMCLAAILPAVDARAQTTSAMTPAARGAWTSAVSVLMVTLDAHPEMAQHNPSLGSVLDRLRLELRYHPSSEPALAFVARLPSAAADPKAFNALPLAEKIKLVDAAVTGVSNAYQSRADSLLGRLPEGAGQLSTGDDLRELDAVAAHWFFLKPETAEKVKVVLAAHRGAKAASLGRSIATTLQEERPMMMPKVAVNAELSRLLAGAAALTREAVEQGREGRLVPTVLAPYAERALAEAESRAEEYGAKKGAVSGAIINNHLDLFGRFADRGMFKTLRARGEWTEFVAALSLSAAQRVAQTGEEGRNLLATAAEGDDLRIAIPDWHPQFGKFASISEWLTTAHGKPDDSKQLTGTRVMTAWGIPVLLEHSFWPALFLGALQFMGMFAPHLPIFGPVGVYAEALAVTVLLYASVLGHEFGHALTAKLFGIRTRKIVLNLLGGGADIVRGLRQALPEFVIAAAGPLVSALLGAALLLLAGVVAHPILAPILAITGKLNLLLAVFNLFPLFPMDGARVLRAALTKFFGDYRATKITAVISALGSVAAMARGVYLLSQGTLFMGLATVAMGLLFLYVTWRMSIHPGTKLVN